MLWILHSLDPSKERFESMIAGLGLATLLDSASVEQSLSFIWLSLVGYGVTYGVTGRFRPEA